LPPAETCGTIWSLPLSLVRNDAGSTPEDSERAGSGVNKSKSSLIFGARTAGIQIVGARIVGPNLGCPEIVSLATINERGVRVIIAAPASENFEAAVYSLKARPSSAAQSRGSEEGEAAKHQFDDRSFVLQLSRAQKLEAEALPGHFDDLSETRLLISTTLRTELFPEHVFWAVWAKPEIQLDEKYFRKAKGAARSTLYDLSLSVQGNEVGGVKHALSLRPEKAGVQFVHLTDLHTAARNDLWESEVPAVIVGSPVTPGRQDFKNFNNRVRKFIRWANQEADEGRLDFVLVLGDLVDFGRTGLFDRTADDSNWSTVIGILTGSPAERRRGNYGFRVPIFTTTGNHDWRTYPYSPEFRLDLFGITKECAKELDLWYRNTAVEIGQKLDEVEQNLIRKGSPLLARSWWGAITSMGLRGITVGFTRLLQRASAVLVKSSRQLLWVLAAAFFGIGSVSDLNEIRTIGVMAWAEALWSGAWHLSYAALRQHALQFAALALLLLALVLTFVVPSWLYAWLRGMLESLIAIEAEVGTIHEYFLKVNPYFNYAFRVENCDFILLDTGPDCLTAQSFWDEGGKKVRRISINDNILGGAPDSMSFYPANEYYPYSQISWLENVLSCIGERPTRKEAGLEKRRIFIGLHAPPANLSAKARKRADDQLQLNQNHNEHAVLMKEGDGLETYDIRYGTVNHYLSQFFYLCLGYRESQKDRRTGPEVDVVFAGHAHWNLEFELRKPDGAVEWSPELWYGNISRKVEAASGDEHATWGPLLLQTAAGGPASDTAKDPPNFRYVMVNGKGEVCHLQPCILKEARPGVEEAVAVDAAPARY
jgi:hypothetical protein